MHIFANPVTYTNYITLHIEVNDISNSKYNTTAKSVSNLNVQNCLATKPNNKNAVNESTTVA